MVEPFALLVLAGASLVVTLAVAEPTYRVLGRLGVMDIPNSRSSHQKPTIRSGGVSVWIGVACVAVAAELVGLSLPWATLAVASVLAVVGFVDDLRHLPATVRLTAQVVAGVVVGLGVGDASTALVGAFAMPVAVNAVNFMDGVNGITGMTIAAWALVVLAAGGAGSEAAAILAALVLGGCLGFLPWNVPKARMFLGDSGSYFLGGVVAGALIESVGEGGNALLVAAPMTIYLFDTGWTLLRRWRRDDSLMSPHRDHLYQRLVLRRRWSHANVAIVFAGLSACCGLAALVGGPIVFAIILFVAAGGLLVLDALPRSVDRTQEAV